MGGRPPRRASWAAGRGRACPCPLPLPRGAGGGRARGSPLPIWPAAAPRRQARPGPGRTGSHQLWAPPRVRKRRGLPARTEGYGNYHPQPHIVVEVVWGVPVAVRAAGVPLIIVPGAPTHHTRAVAARPPRLRRFVTFASVAFQARPLASAALFNQPPSSRPTSLTMRAACPYWPTLISSKSRHRRR